MNVQIATLMTRRYVFYLVEDSNIRHEEAMKWVDQCSQGKQSKSYAVRISMKRMKLKRTQVYTIELKDTFWK